MPETIGFGRIDNNTTATATTGANLSEYSRSLLWPSANNADQAEGIHSFLSARGSSKLREGLGIISNVLPEYSFDETTTPPELPANADTTDGAASSPSSNNGPRDHATSVAEKIAQKMAEASGSSSVERAAGRGAGTAAADASPFSSSPSSSSSSFPPPPSTFRAAALKSVTEQVQIREQRAAKSAPGRAPAGIDPVRVPNLWLAVAHSSSVRSGEVKKVEVDGVPIALWRNAAGDVSAVSDVCIHRGASLSRGWISSDRLICPCELMYVVCFLPSPLCVCQMLDEVFYVK